jgi:transcriptional regulator with XRE-family HTH domain
LRPSNIRALRERHHLAQEQFAALTGIGVASIKRWEAGNLIQGDALDRYLRVLQSPAGFNELRNVEAPQRVTEPKFRTPIAEETRRKAATFALRPCLTLRRAA